jgi:hypothetical protein
MPEEFDAAAYAAKYPCVKCGMCCRKGVCPYGEWSGVEKSCIYLTSDNLCSIYTIIKKNPESEWSPAFGAGCSSPMCNEMREAKIRDHQEG